MKILREFVETSMFNIVITDEERRVLMNALAIGFECDDDLPVDKTKFNELFNSFKLCNIGNI